MPGICGYLDFQPSVTRQALMASMLERMTHYEWYRSESKTFDSIGLGIGRVSLGFVNTAPQPVSIDDGAYLAVLDGELLNADDLRAQLATAGKACTSASHAEIFLRGYLHSGHDFLRNVRGKYVASIWSRDSREWLLISDRYGMKPLYYVKSSRRFMFASELKAMLIGDDVSRAQNHRGIIQFFTFGHLFGEQTLLQDVAIVPAASVVRFRCDEKQFSVESYAKLPKPRYRFEKSDVWKAIDQAFANSVEESVRETDHIGVALSGGMDARTILALIETRQHPVIALCLGMPGSLDQRSARKMAASKGCEYHDFFLDAKFLNHFERHLDRMVHLTDGHYLSQCIVLPTFERYRELGIEVLLRGHAGELMHMCKGYSYSLDAKAFAMRSEADLHGWLFDHLRAYMLDGLDEPLFEFADRNECDSVARDTLRESLQASQDWERPLDRIWQVFVSERLRRETAMSLVKFGSVVETRLPYLTHEVLDALAQAPAEMKLDEEIQTYILKKRYPEFLKITNVNTGAKVGAGALVKKVQSFKMRVFAKLGLPGYQPYERLGLWLRRELKPLVERVLLDETCLQRGTFRPDAVRRVVRQHVNGQKNHTFLIMAMMIYERGQRRLFDPTIQAPLNDVG
jgi:asparagine synthase (glutamine-hydrolysing)